MIWTRQIWMPQICCDSVEMPTGKVGSAATPCQSMTFAEAAKSTSSMGPCRGVAIALLPWRRRSWSVWRPSFGHRADFQDFKAIVALHGSAPPVRARTASASPLLVSSSHHRCRQRCGRSRSTTSKRTMRSTPSTSATCRPTRMGHRMELPDVQTAPLARWRVRCERRDHVQRHLGLATARTKM